MHSTTDFWPRLDWLVTTRELVIDRPRGSVHPRYPSFAYPLDYGYLAGTLAPDGGGLDIWLGSLPERRVTAVLCTVDLEKGDAEIKLLIGCTPAEMELIRAIHNSSMQSAILVRRDS